MVNVHHITPNLIVQSNTEPPQPLLNFYEAFGDLVTGQCSECRRGAHLLEWPSVLPAFLHIGEQQTVVRGGGLGMLILDILEVEVDANPHCRLSRRHLEPPWA